MGSGAGAGEASLSWNQAYGIGGLKGTSKPVYYRISLNENVMLDRINTGSSSLTKDFLEEATYL